jgi:hypothetical protein
MIKKRLLRNASRFEFDFGEYLILIDLRSTFRFETVYILIAVCLGGNYV